MTPEELARQKWEYERQPVYEYQLGTVTLYPSSVFTLSGLENQFCWQVTAMCNWGIELMSSLDSIPRWISWGKFMTYEFAHAAKNGHLVVM